MPETRCLDNGSARVLIMWFGAVTLARRMIRESTLSDPMATERPSKLSIQDKL